MGLSVASASGGFRSGNHRVTGDAKLIWRICGLPLIAIMCSSRWLVSKKSVNICKQFFHLAAFQKVFLLEESRARSCECQYPIRRPEQPSSSRFLACEGNGCPQQDRKKDEERVAEDALKDPFTVRKRTKRGTVCSLKAH